MAEASGSKMSNPCESCERNIRFIRKINGNFMHSLVMPEWFVNQFGGKISRSIKLQTPNGNIYDVAVTENMNRTMLKSGWASFVDANQIEENYTLMFRYLGNALFEVIIFDSNGKEKVLCCAGMKAASDVNEPSSRHVDNSSSSHDGTTQSSADECSDSDGSQKESSYCYRKSAKMPAMSNSSEEISAEDNSLESDRQKLSKYYVLSGQCYLTEAQEVKMLALVKKIRPEIPVLVVQMKKSNVNNSRTLAICKDYTLEHLPCGETVIILQLPRKNKVWKCKLYNRPSRTSDAGRRNLYLGNFVRDNPVREGDICLFQPMTNVKQKRFTMTVHLLSKTSVNHSPGARNGIGSNHGRTSTKKAGDVEEPPTDGEEYSSEHEEHEVSDDSEGGSEPPFMLADKACLTWAQEKKVLEKVEEIESELPLYVAIMRKSNVCRGGSYNTPTLRFGSQYSSRYLVQNSAAGYHRGKSSVISLVLQREEKSRSWLTNLKHSMQHTTHVMKVLKGWTFFAHDNRLREGDLCLFKLIKDKEPLTMVIHVIRREEY
ncbi:B3 domain-containing protein Os03g0620400-like [Triticum aestivum]|uniref:B3 domain-containing protein Os03g0620400-like n=1 Tax=Triticum aestivum TaxID=4565 RepID=UPI001D01E314|nr:B3 domain-containing protein Os03g0620400-like [Triticum aestivum]